MLQYISIIKKLRKVAGENRRLTFLMFVSCAAYNLAGLLPPVATAGIIRAVTEKNYSGIWFYAGLYLLFYVAYFVFLRINYYAFAKMGEFYHISLQKRIFDNISAHPETLEKLPEGRILDSFADDIRWIVDAVNASVESVIRIIQLLIIFAIFLRYNLSIGIIAVLVDMLYLFILNANARREASSYAASRRAEDRAISAFSEMINSKQQTSKTKAEDSTADEQKKKMDSSYSTWLKEYRKKRRAISNRNTTWASIPYVGKIILYILLAKLVIDGAMGIDMLVLLIGYFEMTITCMDKMTTHLLDLSNYGVRIERLKQLL